MVDCPECRKPLQRRKDGRYCCGNNACSVIFVRYPDKPSLMKIVRKAKTRVGFYE